MKKVIKLKQKYYFIVFRIQIQKKDHTKLYKINANL